MQADVNLAKLAKLHREARAEELRREHERGLAKIRHGFADRGLLESTALLQALLEAVVERQRLLAMAVIESIERAHEELGRRLSKTALDEAEARAVEHVRATERCATGEVLQLPEAVRLGPVVRNNLCVRIQDELRRVEHEVRRAIEIRRLKIVDYEQPEVASEWDVFISHASEDKAEFVLPLSRELKQLGVRVWIDFAELSLGDDLRRMIDTGLAKSRFGVVVLSPSFLGKPWPEAELSALFVREMRGTKVILPVLHNLTHEALTERVPLVAPKLCASSDVGVPGVAAQIAAVVSSARETR